MDPRFPQSSQPGELEEFYRIPHDSLCKSTLLGFKDSMHTVGPWTMLEQRGQADPTRWPSHEQLEGLPARHFQTFASSNEPHSSGHRAGLQEADQQFESLHKQRFDLSNNPSRVNFQDRTALRNQMDPRTSSEEYYRVGINNDQSRNSSANKDGLRQTTNILKSSSKYSKPPILQNTSAFGLGSSGMRGQQSFGGANNRSMRANPDHDDLKLKLDKLVANFVTKNGEKDAFKDTFFDQEIFQEIVDSKNYFKLSLDLLKYVLHSGNQPKKKKDDGKKKAGYGK
jgi:hypothetical protein